jgi:hypothetical protein
VSSRGLPAFEAAVHSRIFVQRCGCRSLALPFLRDTLPCEGYPASASFLCAVRSLRQPRAAANYCREGHWDHLSVGKVAQAVGGSLCAMPPELLFAEAAIESGTTSPGRFAEHRCQILIQHPSGPTPRSGSTASNGYSACHASRGASAIERGEKWLTITRPSPRVLRKCSF